jgi:hypothetical protein
VVVNLLVSAAGRDLLTVVGTCIVMLVGDPLLLLMFLVSHLTPKPSAAAVERYFASRA